MKNHIFYQGPPVPGCFLDPYRWFLDTRLVTSLVTPVRPVGLYGTSDAKGIQRVSSKFQSTPPTSGAARGPAQVPIHSRENTL